ncbi:DUF6033 family protein [Campylobacter suis]|uniref:Uncharacterized protein n=1 Tax=Campylobacter suis TaxID=2790657 RepID=A0ABM8Q914_9BACT|nr:DUF6033 family protein [Campylobacter suis]CAD7289474.1 hypothetical protein LMG8286_01824 [Campylobacter suis]
MQIPKIQAHSLANTQDTFLKARLSYNSSFVYASISQMSSSINARGKIYEEQYSNAFSSSGQISIDELKSQLKTEFSYIDFVDYDTKKPPLGRSQVYIDRENLKKMANDENYRAKIFGLIKRETESEANQGAGYKFMDSSRGVAHVTSRVLMSISKDNDGEPPYVGYAAGSFSFEGSSSSSFNPKRDTFKQIQKRIEEKKEQQRLEEKRAEAKRIEQKLEQKHIEEMRELKELVSINFNQTRTYNNFVFSAQPSTSSEGFYV